MDSMRKRSRLCSSDAMTVRAALYVKGDSRTYASGYWKQNLSG
jgi:hypothetical protein